MQVTTYTFTIPYTARMIDVEDTLRLAAIAAEGLHGAANVRLYFGYTADKEKNEISIRRDNPVALDVIKIFTAMALYEYSTVRFKLMPSD